MPTLIQNHKKSVIETRLKKFYTTFNQAILMVKNEYGDYSEWYGDFNYVGGGNLYDDDGNGAALEYTHTQFEKYFAKYFNDGAGTGKFVFYTAAVLMDAAPEAHIAPQLFS